MLKESLASFTQASVENELKKFMLYASRPLSEFKTFEALEMLEALQNVSDDRKHEREGYYRLVYQTARSKGHERVFDTVTKAEKNFRRKNRTTPAVVSWVPLRRKLGAFVGVLVLAVFIVRILGISEPIVLRGSQTKKQILRIPHLPNRFVVSVVGNFPVVTMALSLYRLIFK